MSTGGVDTAMEDLITRDEIFEKVLFFLSDGDIREISAVSRMLRHYVRSSSRAAHGPLKLYHFAQSDWKRYNKENTLLTLCKIKARSLHSGERRGPVVLVAVIDRSSSMESVMVTVKEVLGFVIKELQPTDLFGLVSYCSYAMVDLPITSMDVEGKSIAEERVQAMRVDRGSLLGEGLSEGIDLLRQMATDATGPLDASIMLFSDGPTRKGETDGGRFQSGTDITEMATRGLEDLRSRGVTCHIHTFGFGSHESNAALRRLASTWDGVYYYIRSRAHVAAAFATCLAGIVSVVARTIRLQLRTVRGVEVTAVSTPFEVRRLAPNEMEVLFHDLYADEQRDVIVELKLPALSAPHESRMPVLCMGVTCTDAETGVRRYVASSVLVSRPQRSRGSPSSPRVGDLPVPDSLGPTGHTELEKQRNRIVCFRALDRARNVAGTDGLKAAHRVLSTAREKIATSPCGRDPFCQVLVSDLDLCLADMQDDVAFELQGSEMLVAAAQTHSLQRDNAVTPHSPYGSPLQRDVRLRVVRACPSLHGSNHPLLSTDSSSSSGTSSAAAPFHVTAPTTTLVKLLAAPVTISAKARLPANQLIHQDPQHLSGLADLRARYRLLRRRREDRDASLGLGPPGGGAGDAPAEAPQGEVSDMAAAPGVGGACALPRHPAAAPGTSPPTPSPVAGYTSPAFLSVVQHAVSGALPGLSTTTMSSLELSALTFGSSTLDASRVVDISGGDASAPAAFASAPAAFASAPAAYSGGPDAYDTPPSPALAEHLEDEWRRVTVPGPGMRASAVVAAAGIGGSGTEHEAPRSPRSTVSAFESALSHTSYSFCTAEQLEATGPARVAEDGTLVDATAVAASPPRWKGARAAGTGVDALKASPERTQSPSHQPSTPREGDGADSSDAGRPLPYGKQTAVVPMPTPLPHPPTHVFPLSSRTRHTSAGDVRKPPRRTEAVPEKSDAPPIEDTSLSAPAAHEALSLTQEVDEEADISTSRPRPSFVVLRPKGSSRTDDSSSSHTRSMSALSTLLAVPRFAPEVTSTPDAASAPAKLLNEALREVHGKGPDEPGRGGSETPFESVYTASGETPLSMCKGSEDGTVGTGDSHRRSSTPEHPTVHPAPRVVAPGYLEETTIAQSPAPA